MRTRPEMPRPRRVSNANVSALRTAADVQAFLSQHADQGFPIFSPPTTKAGEESLTVATFCWLASGETSWVFLDANGLTDRGWLDEGLLENIEGTNLWHISLLIPAGWRGSYCFLVGTEALVVPLESGQEAKRQWWLALLETAESDPLNPGESSVSSFGSLSSEAAAPHAPAQTWWAAGLASEAQRPSPQRLELGGVERDVWVWSSADEDSNGAQDRNLAIVFDGRTWVERFSIFAALGELMSAYQGVELVVVLVDSVDQVVRSRDLTCSAPFRNDIADVLVPWSRQHYGTTTDPSRVVVAGQSFGGLAAADLVLDRPDVARNALCLSGSFWWNGPEIAQVVQPSAGEESAQEPAWIWDTRLGQADRSDTWFWMQAGEREGDMFELSARFAAQALANGATVELGEFCGGHDAVQWREALLAGLERFISPR